MSYRDIRDFRGRRAQGVNRAITNMVVTSSTNASALTNGTAGAKIRRGARWKMSPLLSLAEHHVVAEGYQNARKAWLAHWGAGSVAAFAENAAINPASIGSNISTSASTLAPFGLGVALSSDLANQTADFDALKDLLYRMAVEAILDYMSHGATNGLADLATGMTAVTASSNTALAWSSVSSGALAIRNLVGADMELVLVLCPKGLRDLSLEMAVSGGGMWSNQALTPYVKQLFEAGALPNDIGFTGLVRDGINVFCVNGLGSTYLYDDGTDTFGILMVPAPGGEAIDEPMGGICICGYADPSKERPEHEVADQLDGIGIASYDVPPASGEDGSQRFWRVKFDALLLNTDASRVIKYKTT